MNNLENLLEDEKGSILLRAMFATAATPLCAYVGSYVGQGVGYAVGYAIDFVPYATDLAPWLAQRAGLAVDTKVVNLNETLYQTMGAIDGFCLGLSLPWKWLGKKLDKDYRNALDRNSEDSSL